MHRIPSKLCSYACLGESGALLFYLFYSLFQFLPVLFFLFLQMATAPARTLTPIAFLLSNVSAWALPQQTIDLLLLDQPLVHLLLSPNL